MNYSDSVGSHYPESIPGVRCAQQPLKEMKESFSCIFITCVYLANVDHGVCT